MKNLNKQQYEASRSDGGVHLVIAGAGTGKTVTLVEKVRSVIKWGGISPEKILVLTFSRKAAGELKERLGPDSGITAGTFHSYALSLLKNYRDRFLSASEFPSFPAVMDDDSREKIIGDLIAGKRNVFLGMPDSTVRRCMDRDIREGRDMEKLKKTGLGPELEKLRKDFMEIKRIRCLMDFDDIIDFCCRMLEQDQAVLKKVRDSLEYILVDEYQDTSDDNFRLLWLLCDGGRKNLFVVGDDWQSIYGFRNAKVEYIISMAKFFPGVHLHKLTVNYRSRKEIVDLSNRFIKGNKNRTKKKLSSFKGKGGCVQLWQVSVPEEEVTLVRRLTEENSSETGILFRNNWQGHRLLAALPELKNKENVKLMTMHGSKGLEFHTVIITGVKDSIIPDRTTPLEEERRLFYVALSRAEENLHIICYKKADGSLPLFAEELNLKPCIP